MQTVPTSIFRKQLSELLNLVGYGSEEVTIERHGRPLAVLISAEEYERYQRLEDEIDRLIIRQAVEAGELDDAQPFESNRYSKKTDQKAG